MRLSHIAEQIYCKPWLITAGGHASVRQLFEKKMAAHAEEDFSDFIVSRKPAEKDANGIGHVHILGVIGHRLSGIEKSCGCTDVLDVKREIMDLIEKENVKKIMLHVDSPGGVVTGIPELANFIASIRDETPIFAFSDSINGSAAYWLSSACSKIWVSPSAEIGSIGVYIPWVDQSGLWGNIGIKADPIVNTDSPFKATGFGPSLSDEQRSELQSGVDRLADLFKSFVIHGRQAAGAPIKDDAMMGQTVIGLDSASCGLADNVGDEQSCYSDLLMAESVFEREY